MKAITTRYLGPTDTKGSRFIATTEGDNRITISYDYSLNAEDNHKRVAVTLCDKMGWSTDIIGGGTDNGYVWVFTSNEIAELKNKLHKTELQKNNYYEISCIRGKNIIEAEDKLKKYERIMQENGKIITKYNEQKDKLSRRNMQIKDLKAKNLDLRAETIRYREVLDTDVLERLDNVK